MNRKGLQIRFDRGDYTAEIREAITKQHAYLSMLFNEARREQLLARERNAPGQEQTEVDRLVGDIGEAEQFMVQLQGAFGAFVRQLDLIGSQIREEGGE